MRNSLLDIFFFFSTVYGACNYGTSGFPREPQVPVSTFSYTGLLGPLNWFGLNKTANGLCAKGRNQSPIDIMTSNITISNPTTITLTIPSYPSGAKFENLGTNVEVVVNGTLVDDVLQKTYALAQFHFHTPSEHRVNDEFSPMEAHFVFEAQDKSIAVIGILIEFGPTNPLLASVFSSVSAIPTPGNATLTGPLDFSGLQYHLSNFQFYRYSGSLTTPPCSEGVSWIISTQPWYIDSYTYKNVKKVVKFNSRYTQNYLGGTNLLTNAATELNSNN